HQHPEMMENTHEPAGMNSMTFTVILKKNRLGMTRFLAQLRAQAARPILSQRPKLGSACRRACAKHSGWTSAFTSPGGEALAKRGFAARVASSQKRRRFCRYHQATSPSVHRRARRQSKTT